MSNHYHVVLKLDPKRPKQWSDSLVADKWLMRNGLKQSNPLFREKKKALLRHPERVRELRSRLGSLSWFMRHINEPLARKANAEDDCSGRFWEGRFKSVALLDHSALLACMVYVDLNPVRANAEINTPAPHTSASRRAEQRSAGLADLEPLGLSVTRYLNLLNWAGKNSRGVGKSASTDREYPTGQNKEHEHRWIEWVGSFSLGYRAYGLRSSLQSYVEKLQQKWIRNPLQDRIACDLDSTAIRAFTSA